PKEMKEDFYQVSDICGRVAGCGSLGRFRYSILLEGEGSRHAKNVLLEIKESLPSALDEFQSRAPGRDGRAKEVVSCQRLMQASPHRRLGWAADGRASFQVRELSPREARLDWSGIRRLKEVEGI